MVEVGCVKGELRETRAETEEVEENERVQAPGQGHQKVIAFLQTVSLLHLAPEPLLQLEPLTPVGAAVGAGT
jgi:hypothetical protein